MNENDVYRVCAGVSREDLVRRVNIAAAQGFVPCGGLVVSVDAEGKRVLLQTVFRPKARAEGRGPGAEAQNGQRAGGRGPWVGKKAWKGAGR